MPKSDPIAELAQKLLHALQQQRQQGGDYPLSVARLAALADPQATPEQVGKALAKKAFAGCWIIAHKKDPLSPIGLAEDADRLADWPPLLEFALGLVCSADKPLHPLSKVANKVDKSLRTDFQASVQRRAAEGSLPPAVGVQTVRGKLQLYLQRWPPPPPKKKPAEELADRLRQTLIARRAAGAEAYPLTLDRLVADAQPAPAPALLKQALGHKSLKPLLLIALPKTADSPLSLKEDADRLADWPRLLAKVLAFARTPQTQALSVAELKRKVVKGLQTLFADAVNRRLRERVLPEGVGLLHVKRKPLLFLLSDINARWPVPPSPPPREVPRPPEATPSIVAPALDFARLFDEAFARLDREHGGYNHVSLVELRQALPVDRAAFDAGLHQLRRAGRYSLSAADREISAEQQDAGIHEDGSLLLFVARREA